MFTDWVETASRGIEGLAVSIIVLSIIYATLRYLLAVALCQSAFAAYGRFKVLLGRSLLLGLEILVAADVIRTVALDTTLQSVAALGLLVLVRTFLSWSLIVEIEGRWPWQPRPAESSEETRVSGS